MSTSRRDLNDLLCAAIDDTIIELLGKAVLDALYSSLDARYAVRRFELPYRTETLYQLLETGFGVFGAKTVGVSIAQKFYKKLGLTFHSHEGYTLPDYIEAAKTKITRS